MEILYACVLELYQKKKINKQTTINICKMKFKAVKN